MNELAKLLLKARQSGVAIGHVPQALAPADEAAAYAAQADVTAALGKVGGWKIGRPSPDGHGTMAPILKADIIESPGRLATVPFGELGLECEIAFELAKDLPARDRPYELAEIEAAIACMRPAVELVWSRLAAREHAATLLKLADSQINGGLLLGKAFTNWRSMNLDDIDIRLEVDGGTIKARRGGNPGGPPADVLRALADLCGNHCGGLKAGQIVTTGSYTGIDFVHEPESVVATFVGIDKVELSVGA